MMRKKLKSIGKNALKKRVNPHMLRHSSATYWAHKLNRYQICAKYGWAISSDMPDRYIKRKGIIFDEVAWKGDTDQLSKLEMENRQLRKNIVSLQDGYEKVKKALEFIMPVVMDKMDEPEFKRMLFEKRAEASRFNHEEKKLISPPNKADSSDSDILPYPV